MEVRFLSDAHEFLSLCLYARLMRKIFTIFTASVLAAMELSGCVLHRAQNPSFNAGGYSNRSEELEIQEGQRIHDAIVASHYLLTAPGVTQYIEEIGSKLVKSAKRTHLPYRFTILVDERIYSTGAPGGFVYITTGLLDFLESDAELAGILAHEIGQLQYQLPVFSAFTRHTEDLAALSALVGPMFGPIGALSATTLLLLSSVSHEKPLEDRLKTSDQLALKMMVTAGFDPQGLVDVLRRLQRENVQTSPLVYDWMQKRPVTTERVSAVEEEFMNLDLRGRVLGAGYESYGEVMKVVHQMSRSF